MGKRSSNAGCTTGLIIGLTLGLILGINLGSSKRTSPGRRSTPHRSTEASSIPTAPSYTVLTSSINPKRAGFDVLIDRDLNESELGLIARELRKTKASQSELVLVAFFRSREQQGRGAWATARLDPDLRVEILGMTDVDAEVAAAHVAAEMPLENIVGQWRSSPPLVGNLITIYRDVDGHLSLHERFDDGSSVTRRLRESTSAGERRFTIEDNDYGEYYTLRSDGRLAVFDRDGFIASCDPADR